MGELPSNPHQPSSWWNSLFDGRKIPGQIFAGVLASAATCIGGYALSQLKGGWLIHKLNGITLADLEREAANHPGPQGADGKPGADGLPGRPVVWERDIAENRTPCDEKCDYRWKVTEDLGDYGKKWSLRETGWLMFYPTVFHETVIATTYWANSYWVDYNHRGYMRNLQDYGKEFPVIIQKRCQR